MGNFLDSPKTEKETENVTTSTGIDIGATGMQGWRLEMEDEHIATDIPSRPDHTFLAVFDGHGGAGAAHYAGAHMVSTLESVPSWKLYLKGGPSTDPSCIGQAMKEAFIKLDADIRKHQDRTPGDRSGCTSVTAIVTPTHIICANAGDSRCVMGTNGSAKFLSEDHKPYNPLERARIEKAGGYVNYDRVDGDLAVSRALGDFQYKRKDDNNPEEQKVSPYPDITIHERTEKDEILILACDGLWDVMTNEEAINTAYEILQSGENSMGLVAEEMIDLALDKGSRDNISCVVARLPGAKIGPLSLGGVRQRRIQRTGPSSNTRGSAQEFASRVTDADDI